jgi:hypothetical protein
MKKWQKPIHVRLRAVTMPPFKTPQALGSHVSIVHPEVAREKGTAREVPIIEEDFTTTELVGVGVPT